MGGGTALIGDPSGKTDMRKMLSKSDIEGNIEAIEIQVRRFLDFTCGKGFLVNNASWLLDINYIDLLRNVGACFNVNIMLRAECYKKRLEKGLSFLEFNYMIMQAFDFYTLYKEYGCNLEFGGDDQWSNMLAGTELIRKKLGEDAHALTIPLLTNSEGVKMGKTVAGALWLDENKTSVYDFFQYWRNVEDSDVIKCLKMLTFVPIEEIREMEKWEGAELNKAKEILAYNVTEIVHGTEKAQKALETAKSVFAGGGENMPEFTLDDSDFTDNSIDIISVCIKAGLGNTRSDVRRTIEQGGLSVDKEKVTDIGKTFTKDAFADGIVVQRGKKKFVRVRV